MPEPQTREQAAEAAAIRRRWITLGEVLAVVAVVISGLTLWNSYSERSRGEAEREAAKREAAAEAQTLVLRGTPADGGNRLDLVALDAEQAIQSQTIAFPTSLEADPVDTVIEPRIEGRWLKPAIKAAREAADGADKGAGDARLPVLITTRFVRGGETYSDATIYDVGYRLDSGFLTGTDVELRGLSLIRRSGAKDGQAQLDAIWKSRTS